MVCPGSTPEERGAALVFLGGVQVQRQFGGAFQDPEVQAALGACGITLPSAPAAPSDQAAN